MILARVGGVYHVENALGGVDLDVIGRGDTFDSQSCHTAAARAESFDGEILIRVNTVAACSRVLDVLDMVRDAIEKQSNSPGKGNPRQAWYAFACVALAANRPDDALQYLQEAVNRGYKDADALTADDDLKKLRPNPKFQQLIGTLRRPPTKVPAQ